MDNWQLSKKGIRWPVSHDCIAVSSVQFIEETCFLKVSADHLLVWTNHRLNYKKIFFKNIKRRGRGLRFPWNLIKDSDFMEKCKTDKIKKFLFLNFLKYSETRVDYISLLFDRTLRRNMRYFLNVLKYVRKICKHNIIHHFLINENTTTPISMGSKKKLLNTWTQAGLAGVARECCSFLVGDLREDWQGISSARGLATRFARQLHC